MSFLNSNISSKTLKRRIIASGGPALLEHDVVSSGGRLRKEASLEV